MLDLDKLAPESLRPLSRSEYEGLVEQGLFEDERVELLHGLLVRMSPIGPSHAEVVCRLTEVLLPPLLGQARVRGQLPFAATDDSEPEPDLAVVPLGDYTQTHPREASLLVEVADSSLNKDRSIKADLYAAAGVPEYWIVNLVDLQIEVFTEPRSGAYQRARVVRPGDSLRLTAFPDVELAASDVLGGAEPGSSAESPS